jgi:competence protein ComEA
VESRLEAIFRGNWIPTDNDADGTGTGRTTTNGFEPEEPDVDPTGPLGADTRARDGGRRWRIDPGRRAAVAMVAVVALTASMVGWRVLADRPRAEALGNPATVSVSAPATPAASSRSATAAAGSASSGQIVVDVVGKVHHPGIVRLPSGARVNDAVRAAGGAVARTNLTTLNLARVCVDGEQIVVGQAGSIAAPVATGTGTSAAGALVNLNTATSEQLDALPGVGPVMAQRILDWRTAHGGFSSIDQLKQVSGIGDAKYADLTPLVTV